MKKCIFIYICLSVVCNLYAQERKPCFMRPLPEGSRKYSVTFEPYFPLMYGGLLAGFEHRVNNLPHWIDVSPSVYYLPKSDNYYGLLLVGNMENYYLYGLKGAGLDLGYKIFLKNPEIFYCRGGVSYRYFDVSNRSLKLIDYKEDGLIFHTYSTHLQNEKHNNAGVNLCLGIRTTTRRIPFFIDGYLGIAYNYSFYKDTFHIYENNITGFGYTGPTVMIGFKLGYAFGKTKM